MRRLFVGTGLLLSACVEFASVASAHGVLVPGKGFKTLDRPPTCADIVRENLAPCDHGAVQTLESCLIDMRKSAPVFPSVCRGEFLLRIHTLLQQLKSGNKRNDRLSSAGVGV